MSGDFSRGFQQRRNKPSLSLDASIVQDDIPIEICPKIFIGSIHSAFNQETLQANGITHILNCSRLPNTFPKHFTYLAVEVRDKEGANILSCIPTTNIFIEAGIENNGVLVHCFGGKSRSAALIAAYLMSSCNWTFDEAKNLIKESRSSIEINSGFEVQLRAYQVANYDVYVAQQILLRSRVRELHTMRKKSEERQGSDDTPVLHSATDSVTDFTELRSAPRTNSQSIDDANREAKDSKNNDSEMDVEPSALHKRSWYDAKSSSRHEGKDEIEPESSSSGIVNKDLSLAIEAKSSSSNGDRVFKSRYSRGTERLVGKAFVRTDPEIKTPICRLSRPGSQAVRIMPPLRGLEREFKCSWCNTSLFSLANVIRIDIDIADMLDSFKSEVTKAQNAHVNREAEFDSNMIKADEKSNGNFLDEKFASVALSTNEAKDRKPPMDINTSQSDDKDINCFLIHSDDSVTSFGPSSSNYSNVQFSSAPKSRRAADVNKGFDFDFPIGDKDSNNSPTAKVSSNENHGSSSDNDRKRSTSKVNNLSLLKIDNIPGNSNFCDTFPPRNLAFGQISPSQNATHSMMGGRYPVSSRPSSGTSTLVMDPRGVNIIDDSPRVHIPPHRLHETGWSPRNGNGRPQSAEKRRWLARMNLLREGGAKVAKMAEEDDLASQLAFGKEKYFNIEYLSWMGHDFFNADKDAGDIACHVCKKVVGSFIWKPSNRILLEGRLEAPLIRLHKNVVHQMDVPLDTTPLSTPRLEMDNTKSPGTTINRKHSIDNT